MLSVDSSVTVFSYYLIVCRFFCSKSEKQKKVSEYEQETRKLHVYIAAQTNPILHMLPDLLRNTERAALGCAFWSVFLRLHEL